VGRLWQSLALSQWHVNLAYLPVESLFRDRQAEYDEALGAADRFAEATPFVDFMLQVIRETLDAPMPTGPSKRPSKIADQGIWE
jgi:Fic family protein